ncbi:MFS transporter [Chloroflexota bacterium]
MVAGAGFFIWLLGWGTYTPTFGVFVTPLQSEFGWSRADIALAISFSMIVQAPLATIAGWLTDKLGPRLVVMTFGSFYGICYLLLSRVNTIWQFQASYAVLAAIGISAINIPVMATIARWFVQRRGLMMGITQSGMGIGGLIFAPFAAWLIVGYGWRSTYIILGIITLAGILLSGLLLKRDPGELGLPADGEGHALAPEGKNQAQKTETSPMSIKKAARTRQFWIVAGLFFSFGFCRSTFNIHIAPHVQDLGFTLAQGAAVLAVLNGSSIVGRVGMGRIADIVGNRTTFMISYAITAMILIWGLVATDLWALYLFGIVFGIGWGAQAVLRFSVTSEVFGGRSLGLLMGIFGLAEAVAATFGSYFAGYVFDSLGSYQLAFWIGIVLAIAGIVLAWSLKRTRR